MNTMQHLFGYMFNPFEPVNLRIDESAIKDIYKVPDMFILNYCPPNNIWRNTFSDLEKF